MEQHLAVGIIPMVIVQQQSEGPQKRSHAEAMQQTDDAGMKKMLQEANEIIGDSIEAMNR